MVASDKSDEIDKIQGVLISTEVDAKLEIDLGVIAVGVGELGICLWMDDVAHRPAAFRARASDSSKGMG